ncbi:hypothetical protein ACXO9B_06975 [Lactobacillus delbrueckii subsp. bulgaricus]
MIQRTPHLMGLLPLEWIKIIKKVAGQQQLLSDSQILAEVSSSLGLAADQRAVKSRCVLLVEGQEDVRFVAKINQWMYEKSWWRRLLLKKCSLFYRSGDAAVCWPG